MLWRALSSIGQGFYIDVGASEPLADSVTAAFYERGWSGINIEPMAGAFDRLAAARQRDTNLQLALEEAPGTASYFSVGNGNGISTGVSELGSKYKAENWSIERVPVTVSTLRAVCEEHVGNRPIHFLKIDVEGKEREVLLGSDFSRFRPWIVLIEATFPNSQTPTHHEWERLLLEQGYSFVYLDGLNRFYVAREKLELLQPHFLAPPNWFDHFVRASEALSYEQAAAAQAVSALQTERLIALEAQIAKGQDELRVIDAGWRLEKSAREALEHRLAQSQIKTQRSMEAAAVQTELLQQLQQELQHEQGALGFARTRLGELERMNDVLNTQIETYTQEAFESSRHIAWLSRERMRLGQESTQLSQRLSLSEGAHQETTAALREQLRSIESLHVNLKDKEAMHATLIDAIYRTLSWRITRPLRWVRRRVASQR